MRLLIGLLVALVPSLSWAGACDTLTKKVCPAGADIATCGAFVDTKIVDAAGKVLTGVPRLTACKLVLDDAETLARFTAEMTTQHATRWFEFDVRIEATRDNGKSWDALGGAPDIAACFVVDGNPMQCVPKGDSHATVPSPKCKNAYECTFRVQTQPGAPVSVDFVDVDASDNDLIAGCIFNAGEPETLKCPNEAKITLRP